MRGTRQTIAPALPGALRGTLPGALAVMLLAAGAAVAAPGTVAVNGTFHGEHGATGAPGGRVAGTLDPATGALHYHISFSGLSGPVTAAHFHGPAAPGVDAGVLKPIAGPYAAPLDGTVTLSPAQVRELRDGKVYVNLHTASHPNGEARAQLDAEPAA